MLPTAVMELTALRKTLRTDGPRIFAVGAVELAFTVTDTDTAELWPRKFTSFRVTCSAPGLR